MPLYRSCRSFFWGNDRSGEWCCSFLGVRGLHPRPLLTRMIQCDFQSRTNSFWLEPLIRPKVQNFLGPVVKCPVVYDSYVGSLQVWNWSFCLVGVYEFKFIGQAWTIPQFLCPTSLTFWWCRFMAMLGLEAQQLKEFNRHGANFHSFRIAFLILVIISDIQCDFKRHYI